MRRKQILTLDMKRVKDLYYMWETVDPFFRWLEKKGYYIPCTCGMKPIHTLKCEAYKNFVSFLTEFIESLPKQQRYLYGGKYEDKPSKK